MDRLKVLFITVWYPTKDQPLLGVFVREHAKAVQLYDDVVVLHCVGVDQSLKGLWRIEKEADQSLTRGIPTFRVWYQRSPIPKTSFFIYLWSIFHAFRYIVAHGSLPDIIHAHIYMAGVPAVLIGRLNRIPVVVTEQFTGFVRKLLRGTSVWQARLAFEWAELVMPVSEALKRAIEEYRINTKFQVIPNAVDVDLFHPGFSSRSNGELKRLLFVALLDPSHKKGMPYLLQALALLRQERDDWHLDIVGDGPARKEYEQLAADLGLTDKVTFHGFKSKPEVAEFMRRSELFVVPSLFETFCAVAAEALATGTPVLATRCGGPEEFVTDEVGMVVPSGDAKALCEGLVRMLDNLSLYSSERISDYAIERFSLESVGAEFHKSYGFLKS